MSDRSPPPGFEPLQPLDETMVFIGPLYWLKENDHIALAFYVSERHCNRRGNCHGGVLASFADLMLGFNAAQKTKLGGPTVSLTIDYLRAAPAGAWVEGRSEVLHHSPGFAFVQCIVTVDGQAAVRASGTFRLKWPQLEYSSSSDAPAAERSEQ